MEKAFNVNRETLKSVVLYNSTIQVTVHKLDVAICEKLVLIITH